MSDTSSEYSESERLQNICHDCEECRACGNAQSSSWHIWRNISYTTRVTLSFALIAAMTALVAIGVLSFVWEDHFRAYTRDNLKTVATHVAEQTALKAASYDDNWFRDEVFQSARSAVNLYPGLAMRITSNASHKVVFDSTMVFDGQDIALEPISEQSVVKEPIVIKTSRKSVEIGQVEVWIIGSDLLLRSSDRLFRDQSYQAMLFGATLAIVLASCIGYLFARGLVNPINCMTKTAREIQNGNLSARSGLIGEDEVSRLGMTFDKMADSIEKDRELERRLTTDVAHELRTPLMAIQSTVEAMVDKVFEPTTERLETVNSEAQRLGRLVDALLKLSRLENRSTPLETQLLNLGELIEGVILTHDMFVKDSGLNLSYEYDKDVYVKGDPDMLRQVTANLISNAVRYTPEGGSITVAVRKGETMASIMVKDTGIGLSEEEVKMVFSRFWRADAGRNRDSGGLGIGLAVVKEIVDQHRGWVRVEGEPGKGATFTIMIPLYQEEYKRKSPWKNQRQPEFESASVDDGYIEIKPLKEGSAMLEQLNVKPIAQGKVRDLYDLGDRLLIVASDRISAFDYILEDEIPYKGKLLTQMSVFWFSLLDSVVENHLISTSVDDLPEEFQAAREYLDGRIMIVKKAHMFPVECIVRGYITGSGLKEYEACGSVCGIELPCGLVNSSRLENPLFTPSTKAEIGDHDENVSFEAVEDKIGKEKAAKLRDLSLAIYTRAAEHALSKGIIIADTKFEFGEVGAAGDKIILADEVLTPDSSRFWDAKTYKPGEEQASFDKQLVRNWLKENWDFKGKPPRLPQELIEKTSEKYIEAYERITGKKFVQ